jgi:tRNA(adenine34) deaminase
MTNSRLNDLMFMREALIEAELAMQNDEVPVGSIVVLNNVIVGRGHNQVIQRGSVVAHAEIIAIEDASNFVGNYRLNGAVLYSTLEPCHMCAKAIIDARIRKVCFGAKEPKTGALVSIDNFFEKPYLNHKVELTSSILQKESSAILKKFFYTKRS